MNELKAGALLNYISIVTRLATQFFLTPFILSSLGQDEYGIFMLSNSVIVWLSLTDFGLKTTINKYVAMYHARNETGKIAHFLGQSMVLFSCLGIFTALCGIVCYFYLGDFFPNLTEEEHGTLQILYLLTLANLILSFPLRPVTGIASAYMKFIAPGIVELAASLLNAGLVVLLLCWGFKAIGLTVLSVSTGLATMAWGLYYSFRWLGVRLVFSKPDWPLYAEMFQFSFWILLNQLMDLFYWRAGTPILARTSGAAAVTIFSLGISFSQYFMTASTAISGVIYPKVMHMVAQESTREQLTDLMTRIGRIQVVLLTLILSVFLCCGHDFLQLWVGKTIGSEVATVWAGAALVLVVLLIPLTQNTGIAILQALNIHKGRAIILFYSSVLCVILGYLISLRYGAIGMFAGTAISLFFGQILLINRYYSRKAGLHIRRFFAQVYLPLLYPVPLLLLAGIAGAALIKLDTWTSLIVFMSCYGVVFTAVLWRFYLNESERDLFLEPLKKLINARKHEH